MGPGMYPQHIYIYISIYIYRERERVRVRVRESESERYVDAYPKSYTSNLHFYPSRQASAGYKLGFVWDNGAARLHNP